MTVVVNSIKDDSRGTWGDSRDNLDDSRWTWGDSMGNWVIAGGLGVLAGGTWVIAGGLGSNSLIVGGTWSESCGNF